MPTNVEYNPDSPGLLLGGVAANTVRLYEAAAVSIGRLDAVARLSSTGFHLLLSLRCAARALNASADGMIALLSPEGERGAPLRIYHGALQDGSARARGGVMPSLGMLNDLLGLGPPETPVRDAVDAILVAREDLPPLLKAVLAAGAILRSPAAGAEDSGSKTMLASLTVSLVLCVGGVTSDAWLTLPVVASDTLAAGPSGIEVGEDAWLGSALAAIGREARAAQDGLSHAAELAEADIERVKRACGRAAYSALDVLALLRSEMAITVGGAARALALTTPTAGAAIARLTDLGIAHEVTGRARSRTFVYTSLVEALAPAR